MALVVFPGGFGTLDETVRGAHAPPDRPHAAHPRDPFGPGLLAAVLDFQFLADEGCYRRRLELFRFAETADEAWDIIRRFHHI